MDFTIFFDNPIIFIILVAVISALFRKKKESSRDPEGPRRTNQPLDKRPSQTQTTLDEVREVFKELSRSFSNPTASSNQKREDPYYEEKKVEELTEPTFVEQEIEPLITDSPLRSMIQETPKEKAIEVDRSKIVDAIIWTEILGPPRSKKPYMKK